MKEKTRRQEIDEQIKALKAERAKLDIDDKIESLEAEKASLDDEKDDEKLSKEEIAELYKNYQIPEQTEVDKTIEQINKYRQINVYTFGLGIVYAIVSYFIGGLNAVYSSVLGVLTSLFCQTILINDYKKMATIHISKYRQKAWLSYIKRFAVYAFVLYFVYVYQDEKGFILLYTFIGYFATKISTMIYFLVNKGGFKN